MKAGLFIRDTAPAAPTPRILIGGATISNQIRKWKAEHADFVRLLGILKSQIGLFHQEAEANYELMLDIVYYLTQFPDRFHHPREDIAFGKLAEWDPSMQIRVRELLGEHKVIASAGKRLVEQLDAILAGAMLEREAVEVNAATYIAYYRQHMVGEETDLFPRLEGVLGNEDWKAVGDAITPEADPLFGGKVGQRYQRLHRQIMLASEASDTNT
jgi:hemerythrin-like domain-containing protein